MRDMHELSDEYPTPSIDAIIAEVSVGYPSYCARVEGRHRHDNKQKTKNFFIVNFFLLVLFFVKNHTFLRQKVKRHQILELRA